MSNRSMVSIAVAATALLLPSPGTIVGQLTPTPVGGQTSSSAESGVSSLDIPQRWSTLEDGMLIPHPVTINGRVLMVAALQYFAVWGGLGDFSGARKALSDYLLLAALSENPELLDRYASTYALRLLSDGAKDEYVCSPAEEILGNEAHSYCGSAQLMASITFPDTDFNFWTGVGEAEKRQTRQAFLDHYGDRFIAAAPNVPIELLDIGFLETSLLDYDQTRGGYLVTYGLPITHPFYGGLDSQIWFSYETDIGRASIQPNRRTWRYLSELWPTDSTTGQTVFRRFRAQGISVPVRYYFTLTAITGDSMESQFEANLRFVSAVAYSDALLEQELYRLECRVISSCLAGTVR